MKCKICGVEADTFGSAVIRGRHTIRYFVCPDCRFVQTEPPHWLAEAYSQPITSSDVGYVSRNLHLARITRALIRAACNSNGRFVDYGGGYGLFVRLMRDSGFDFYRADKYCPNLFCGGFEAGESGSKKFDLLTAFEVFEHLEHPLAEIQTMLEYSDNVFFSTELIADPPPPPDQWWYYGTDHGQHISLYSKRALQVLADKFNLQLRTNGRNLHWLGKNPPSRLAFNLFSRSKIAAMLDAFCRRDSLMPSDHQKILRDLNRHFTP